MKSIAQAIAELGISRQPGQALPIHHVRRIGPDALEDGNEEHAAIALGWLFRACGDVRRFALKDGARLYVTKVQAYPCEPLESYAHVHQQCADGLVMDADVKAVPLCRALEAHCPGWWHP